MEISLYIGKRTSKNRRKTAALTAPRRFNARHFVGSSVMRICHHLLRRLLIDDAAAAEPRITANTNVQVIGADCSVR